MNSLVFTQLSIPEVKEILREELQQFFNLQQNSAKSDDGEIGGLELAERITGLKRPTIYNLVSTRRIPFSKQGKKIYFYKKDLLQWIEEGKRKTQKEIALSAAN